MLTHMNIQYNVKKGVLKNYLCHLKKGGLEKVTSYDMGGGVKNLEKISDMICGRPLNINTLIVILKY